MFFNAGVFLFKKQKMAIQHRLVNDENDEAHAYKLKVKRNKSTQNTLSNMNVMKFRSDDFYQLFKTIMQDL